jgi:hypothetical protein
MILLLACLLSLAALSGVLVYQRSRKLERFERLVASFMPILATLLAVEVFVKILTEPLETWNDVRLARTFALFNGTKLYPGANVNTPIVGTLHTPMSHILFWPATLAKAPVCAIYIGSVTAFVLVFAPILWLHLQPCLAGARSVLLSSYALLTCGYVVLQGSPEGGMRYCAFHIHTDAAAICFATIAAGLIYQAKSSPRWGRLWSSSLFAILSLCSKQTMAPFLLALCAFLLLAYGMRAALRYLSCLLASGVVVSSVLAALFWPPKDVFFNIATLASHRPWVPGQLSLVSQELNQEVLPVAFSLLLYVLYWYFYDHGPSEGWRTLFSTQQWLVFPLIGVLLFPVCVKARLTVGGDSNHVGACCFFLMLGVTLGISQFMNDETSSGAKAAASKLFATALIVVSLPGVVTVISHSIHIQRARTSSVSLAYAYALKYPGRAYFPWNPLAEFFAQHRFYHFDSALQDREFAGYGISRAQYTSGIPSDFALVAFPRDEPISRALQDYLSGWQQVNDPELPGWIVFQRPPAAPRNPR